jgi:hypothetical protein
MTWDYENVPSGADYVRTWRYEGQEWVTYRCSWPGPEAGTYAVVLRDPDGLASGTWEVTVMVDDLVVLQEDIFVEGNWQEWEPVGTFSTCSNEP